MAQQRPIAVYGLAVMAVVLLVWMIIEKDQVSECSKLLETKNKKSSHELSDHSIKKLSDLIKTSIQRDVALDKNRSQATDKWDYNWDRMAPKSGEPEPTQRRVLVLVRHGQYDFTTGRLTELGKRQANLTGLRLKQMGLPYSQIIHSDMIRAQETASIVHTHMPEVHISEDEMIKEGGPLKPSPTITYWGLPDKDYHTDGPRIEAAFRKYFFRADSSQIQSTVDILIAHGNILRYFMLRALQLETSAWMRVFIAHASITEIECNRDGSVTMTKLGDSGHLPANMVTY